MKNALETNFLAVNKTADIPEILLYGFIGGTNEKGVSSADFVRELKKLEKESDTINIRINSSGGSVFEGLTMYSAIKNSKANINIYIDGIAASMASIVAIAGEKVYMSDMARMMTHRPSGASFGRSENLRQNAALLDSLEGTMCAIYANKTGLNADEAKNAFLDGADKWFNAKDALAAGLIAEIFDSTDTFDIPATATSEESVWAIYSEKLNNKINMGKVNLDITALASLGLTADADITAVNAAIASITAEKTKLQNDLQASQTAKSDLEAKLKAEREKTSTQQVGALLDTAIADKRITVALRAKLEKQYAGKPDELKDILADMPAIGSVVDVINNATATGEISQLMAKSYDELDKEGRLERLKELSSDNFNAKFKEKFGKDYK